MKKILKLIFPVLFIILSLFIGFLVYQYVKSPSSPIVNYAKQAEDNLSEKKYSSALENFKKAINQNPKDVQNYVKASSIYVLKSDYENALKILKEGEKNATSDEIYVEILKVYLSTKDFENAYTYGSKIKGVNNDNIYFILASKLKFNKLDESKEFLNTYLSQNLNNEIGINLIASMLNYSTDITKAKENLSNATILKEGESDQLSKYVKDLNATYERIINDKNKEQIDTNNSNIARIMILNDLNYPAITLLDEVVKKNPEFDLLFLLRGIAKLQSNDVTNALTDLERANTLNSTREETLVYLARTYGLSKNIQAATSTYDKALIQFPKSENILYNSYVLMRDTGQYLKAENNLLNLISLSSQNQINYKIEQAHLKLDLLLSYDETLVIINDIENKFSEYKDLSTSTKMELSLMKTWATYKASLGKDKKLDPNVVINQLKDVEKEFKETSARKYFYIGSLYSVLVNPVSAKENLERAIDLDLKNEFSKEARELINKSK